jgi:hypothetical protein
MAANESPQFILRSPERWLDAHPAVIWAAIGLIQPVSNYP